MTKKTAKDCPSEEHEQIIVCEYLDLKRKLYFAVPNGGKRNIVTAVRLSKSGVKAGVPDLIIPEPVAEYHGLIIEMKRKHGGALRDNQKWWLDQLRHRGYMTAVCKGADQAIKVIENYFNHPHKS